MSGAAKSEAALYHRRLVPDPCQGALEGHEPPAAGALPQAADDEGGVGRLDVGRRRHSHRPLSGLPMLDVDGPRGEVKLKELGNPLMPMVRTAGGTIFVLQAPWRGRPHRDPGRTRARRESRRRLRRSTPSLGANGRRYE